MDVISCFTTETIILRKTVVSCTGVESVCTLINLEFAISLTEAKASLSGQYETNFGIEIRDQHFSVHSRNECLLSINICEIESKRASGIIMESNLLQS